MKINKLLMNYYYVSRVTFAQMEAADTIGNKESAFLETVIETSGKFWANFAWYLLAVPTVST